MISQISLENFKGFRSLDALDIKPVTILCGMNSCGKTCILQSILLFKQTLESHALNQTLMFNGRFVRLGTFRNIIYQKDPEKTISFEFSFKVDSSELKNRLILDELTPKGTIGNPGISYRIHYKVAFRTAKERNPEHYLMPIMVSHLSFRLEAITKDGKTIPGGSLEMNLIEPPVYSIKCKSIRGGRADDELNAGVNFVNIFPLSLNTEGITEDLNEPRYNRLVKLSLLSGMDDFLKIIFNSYSYIGPLREEPSRRYIYEDEVVEIGIKGENATYLYLTEQDRYIDDHCFYDSKNDAFVSKKRLSLGVAVQKWLAVMNIQGFRPEPLNEVIYLNMNSSLSDTTRVNVADVGFGVSQIFPIILEGLRMPTGNTLILEQPEIHLHPKLQMQMADYFIALALSNKKILAETHSDHLIRQLIRRVADDESGQLREMVGIYFIRQTDHGAKVQEITTGKNRGIINWPESFSDPLRI